MRENTYNIITIGCQMNKSDSERIASYLEEYGFSRAKNKEEAEIVVINTCGVRQSAENRIYGLIPGLKRANPGVKIVLAGCLSEREDVKKKIADKVDVWLPIVDLPKLDKMLGLKGAEVFHNDYLKIAPKYNSNISAFVPIGNGCDNFCTYCVVPFARGREKYRKSKEIYNEVENLINRGYKEIILIAQNVNSYKVKSIKLKVVDFPKLLQLIDSIPGDHWLRFATGHPKDMSDKLINTVAQSEHICEHIHLPAQAGDSGILKKMNRGYTVGHYRKLIKKIRQVMPNASITTDIIVGFPGETKKAFANTAKLFKEVKFDMAYIAKYSPRPGTSAFKFEDDVSAKEKKQREEDLMKILRRTALEHNKKYIGQTVKVLLEGKNKKGRYFGKTRTNKNVQITDTIDGLKIGEFFNLKIIKARDFGLAGKIEN
ncbi:tRNA (N6-isopentenyl adenosine(37)-C2)-methylthiotransferase MiaB [bacterium]|nr:tRNA (N6-isopentenyl adenosine(37)-C2)-methylthiotransferase MiaB [bacterium]